MKKYLVIGNPIEHSLSPKLHNHWIKKNNIDAIYEKQKLDEFEIQSLITKVRKKKLNGINVTVPFKRAIIPYLDRLSLEAESTQSVNTVYLDNVIVPVHSYEFNTEQNGNNISSELSLNFFDIAKCPSSIIFLYFNKLDVA